MAQDPSLALQQKDFALSNEILDIRHLMDRLFGTDDASTNVVSGFGLNELLDHQAQIPHLYTVLQEAEKASKNDEQTTPKQRRTRTAKNSQHNSPDASYDDDDPSFSERAQSVYTKKRQSFQSDYSVEDLMQELSEAASQASEQDSMQYDSEISAASSDYQFVSMASYSVDASENEPEQKEKTSKKKARKKKGGFLSKLSRSNQIQESALASEDIVKIKHAEQAASLLSQIDHYALSCLVLLNVIVRPGRNSLFTQPSLMLLPVHSKARTLFRDLSQQKLAGWLNSLKQTPLFQVGEDEAFFHHFYSLKLRLANESTHTEQMMTHNDCLHPAYLSFYEEIQAIDNAVARSRRVNDGIEQYIIEVVKQKNRQHVRIMPVGKPNQSDAHQPLLQYSMKQQSPQDPHFTLTPLQLMQFFQSQSANYNRIGFAQTALIEGETEEFYGLYDRLCRETAISTLPFDEHQSNPEFSQTIDRAITEVEFAPEQINLNWHQGDPDALTYFFKINGLMLSSLHLDFSPAVTDDIFTLLTRHCQSLKTLSIIHAPITAVYGSLEKLTSLNVSLCLQLDNTAYSQIEEAFPILERLTARQTQIDRLKTPQASIQHVDLSGCAGVGNRIFDEVSRLNQRLKSLSLCNTSITEFDADSVNVDHLNVSNCSALTVIEATKRSKNQRRTTAGLVSLNADHCHNLSSVTVNSIERLFEVSFRHNRLLSTIAIAPDKIAANLAIIRVNGSFKLKYVQVHPLAVQIFDVGVLPSLKHRLSSQLNEKLLDQVIASSLDGAQSSALLGEMMLRTIPNAANWIERVRGPNALNGVNFEGMDARGLSFSGLFLIGACFKNAKFSGNDFSRATLHNANVEGATWGQNASIKTELSNITTSLYSPSGYYVAASSIGQVAIFDDNLAILQRHDAPSPASCLVLSDDDRYLVVPRRKKLWVTEGLSVIEKELRQLREQRIKGDDSEETKTFVTLLESQHAALKLLSGDCVYLTYVYDLERPGDLPRILYLHSDVIHCAEFSPDGKQLATSSDDKSITVIDFASGEIIKQYLFLKPVNTLKWSQDGKIIACNEGEDLVLINLATDKRSTIIKSEQMGHAEKINTLCFGQNPRSIYTGSDDKKIKHWVMTQPDGQEGPMHLQVLNTLYGHKARVTKCELLADGKHLASSSSNQCEGEIWVWSLSGQSVCQKIAIAGPLNTFAIQPDAQRPEGGWEITTGSNTNMLGQHIIDGDLDPHPRLAPRHHGLYDFGHCDISGIKGLSKNISTLFKQGHAEGKPWDPSQENKKVRKKKRVKRKIKKIEKDTARIEEIHPAGEDSTAAVLKK